MAKIDLLTEIIKIAETSTKAIRTELNKNIHVVDLNWEALKVGDPQLHDYEYFDIIQAVSDNFHNARTLEVAIKSIRNKDNTELYVDDPTYGRFLVGSNYGNVQSALSSVLKDLRGVSELLSVDSRGNSTANIGHIVDPSRDLSITSPSAAKLNAILKLTKNRPKAFADINTFISELYELHAPYVEASVDLLEERGTPGEFRKLLGKYTVLVTLQSRNVNQNVLGKVEADIVKRLTQRVSGYDFSEYLLNKKGSNSILEDLEEHLLNQLDPKTFKQSKLHIPKESRVILPNIKGVVAVTSSKVPKLRNKRGQFISPVSIKSLLNKDLATQIQKNMGKGAARSVLNYRTGRFANSAEVSNVLIRDGYVEAFYTYMRNPYATFEPSGQQGFPTSRDPRKLIEKSIRQIASTIITNRLKATPQ